MKITNFINKEIVKNHILAIPAHIQFIPSNQFNELIIKINHIIENIIHNKYGKEMIFPKKLKCVIIAPHKIHITDTIIWIKNLILGDNHLISSITAIIHKNIAHINRDWISLYFQ